MATERIVLGTPAGVAQKEAVRVEKPDGTVCIWEHREDVCRLVASVRPENTTYKQPQKQRTYQFH